MAEALLTRAIRLLPNVFLAELYYQTIHLRGKIFKQKNIRYISNFLLYSVNVTSRNALTNHFLLISSGIDGKKRTRLPRRHESSIAAPKIVKRSRIVHVQLSISLERKMQEREGTGIKHIFGAIKHTRITT